MIRYLIIFLLVALVPTLRAQTPQARGHLQRAQELYDDGRSFDAVAHLDQAIAQQPSLVEAYRLRGTIRAQQEELAEAIVDFTSAVHLRPEFTEARFELAQALFAAQRYAAAQKEFTYLLEQDAGETQAVYFVGTTTPDGFVASGLTTAQSSSRWRADLYNYLGLCCLYQQALAQAERYFAQALTLSPQEANVYANLGLLWEAQQDTSKAIRQYQQALRILPDHPVALRNLTHLARQTQQYEALLPYIDSKTEVLSYDALLQRGFMELDQDQLEASVSSFSQALAQWPQSTEALLHRGFAYEKLEQWEAALADYTRALRLDPTLEKAYVNRGNVHFKQGAYDEALPDYTEVLTHNPDNTKVLYNRGITYHQLHQSEAACQDLAKANALGYAPATQAMVKVCVMD